MTKLNAPLAALVLLGLAPAAQAAFFYEGVKPLMDAPNCNDAYATTCGRYGQVPHENATTEEVDVEAPVYVDIPEDAETGIRTETREGLEK